MSVKKINYFHAAIIAVLLTACSGELSSIRHEANESAIACPSENFFEFLTAFADNDALQRAFTRFPLRKMELDLNAEPEPVPVIKTLPRLQVQYPLLPLQAERNVQSLSLRIDEVSAHNAKATLFKEDTDYQVSYFFGKNGCWRLESIEDWSL